MWFQTSLALAVLCLTLGAIIPHHTEDVERIVGGRNGSILQFPWQASLINTTYGRLFCGGTIINRYTILTAAHCIHTNRPDTLMVRVGSSFHNRGGYTRHVRRIARHEGYNEASHHDKDIALLILTLPLLYSERVQPANLPKFDYDLGSNVTLTVSGWGTRKFGDRTLPNRLLYVEIPTIDQEVCRQAHRNINGTEDSVEITDNMFCAGAPGGGKDSCQGDSGGPVVERIPGQATAIVQGIVSFGIGCAEPDYPGVNTRVSRFLDWIEANQ